VLSQSKHDSTVNGMTAPFCKNEPLLYNAPHFVAVLFAAVDPNHGQVAQLVEQRTENPRVGGSTPPLATTLGDSSSEFTSSAESQKAAMA
jgi:hypothetical protein